MHSREVWSRLPPPGCVFKLGARKALFRRNEPFNYEAVAKIGSRVGRFQLALSVISSGRRQAMCFFLYTATKTEQYFSCTSSLQKIGSIARTTFPHVVNTVTEHRRICLQNLWNDLPSIHYFFRGPRCTASESALVKSLNERTRGMILTVATLFSRLRKRLFAGPWRSTGLVVRPSQP